MQKQASILGERNIESAIKKTRFFSPPLKFHEFRCFCSTYIEIVQNADDLGSEKQQKLTSKEIFCFTCSFKLRFWIGTQLQTIVKLLHFYVKILDFPRRVCSSTSRHAFQPLQNPTFTPNRLSKERSFQSKVVNPVPSKNEVPFK